MVNRILIVEDEARIAAFIAKGLQAAGYTPTTVTDGIAGLDYAVSGEFDLAIIDIGLPGMDGFSVVQEMRRHGNAIPVIILTARDSVGDTVRGLEGGADDYLAKPFRFAELMARIRLRLRSRPPPTEEQTLLTTGDIALDLVRREVTVTGRPVELSAREFKLAEMFLRHPGHVLSREQLLSHVWGYEFDPGSNVVDVYVGYLRRSWVRRQSRRCEARDIGSRARCPPARIRLP